MPAPKFSVKVSGVQEVMNDTALNEKVRTKIILNSLRAAGAVVEAEVKKQMPVRSGQTRGRVTTRMVVGKKRTSAIVGVKSISSSGFNIALGLETGTGLFGPKKQIIKPKNAKALSWVPSTPVTGTAVGGRIFRKSVKGMKPRRPFQKAYQASSKRAIQVFNRSLALGVAAAKAKAV